MEKDSIKTKEIEKICRNKERNYHHKNYSISGMLTSIPAGTSKNVPSGDHANLLKKDGNVSSWNRCGFDDTDWK